MKFFTSVFKLFVVILVNNTVYGQTDNFISIKIDFKYTEYDFYLSNCQYSIPNVLNLSVVDQNSVSNNIHLFLAAFNSNDDKKWNTFFRCGHNNEYSDKFISDEVSKKSNTLVEQLYVPSAFEIVNESLKFNIFPNPSNGKFTIFNTGKLMEKINWKIYNSLGEILLIGCSNSNFFEIYVGDMSSNVYFIKIYSDNISYCDKLIVR